MAKRKPLDLTEYADVSRQPEKPFPSLAFLALFAVFAAIFLAAYFFLLPPQPIPPSEEKIDVFLVGGTPLFENSTAAARAYSSCGSFGLFLDGSQIAQGEARAEAVISPSKGEHVLSASNAKCSYRLNFMVVEKQCDGSEQAPCTVGACEGVKTCSNGIFSGCVLPRKICVPGERTGCSLDGCKFGYETCDQCGTGFGPCLPVPGTENSMVCIPGNNSA